MAYKLINGKFVKIDKPERFRDVPALDEPPVIYGENEIEQADEAKTSKRGRPPAAPRE